MAASDDSRAGNIFTRNVVVIYPLAFGKEVFKILQGIAEKRYLVAQVAAEKQAAYERWEQSLLLDELTDQSERLARPMEHGFTYELETDGKLYSEYGDKLEAVLDGALVEAGDQAVWDPANWQFEYERRVIERQEIDDIQSLQHGEKLITFSPIPDEVLRGETNLNGYNRERKKMLVRVAERSDNEVGIFHFSLDGSNYAAMQAAAQSVGTEIPEGLGAKEILSRRMRFDGSHELSLNDCHQFIREAYDMSMERQFGGRFYAGRKEISEGDALSFIKSQPDLISQHMEAVKQVMALALDKVEKAARLEKHRYNFAAALDFRMKGWEFDDLADAGDIASDAGLDYSGDCATGSSGSQADALGFAQGKQAEQGGKKWMGCPYCGTRVYADVCAPVCSACGATGKHGPTRTLDPGKQKPENLTMFQHLEQLSEEKRLQKEAETEERRAKKAKAKQLGKSIIEKHR